MVGAYMLFICFFWNCGIDYEEELWNCESFSKHEAYVLSCNVVNQMTIILFVCKKCPCAIFLSVPTLQFFSGPPLEYGRSGWLLHGHVEAQERSADLESNFWKIHPTTSRCHAPSELRSRLRCTTSHNRGTPRAPGRNHKSTRPRLDSCLFPPGKKRRIVT